MELSVAGRMEGDAGQVGKRHLDHERSRRMERKRRSHCRRRRFRQRRPGGALGRGTRLRGGRRRRDSAGGAPPDARTAPDIVVADLFLDDGNSIELLRDIREWRLATRVVVLTGARDAFAADEALAAGAFGYVLKGNRRAICSSREGLARAALRLAACGRSPRGRPARRSDGSIGGSKSSRDVSSRC